MITKIIKWSLENKFIVLLLGTILFIFGSLSIFTTPVDVLPEFAPPQVVIQTNAPGFASEEVEYLITIPLENVLNGTSHVQTVRSSSIEGLSFITVVFNWGTDVYTARQLVSEKIQRIASSFPAGIKSPILSPVTSPVGSVYMFALNSKQTPLIDIRTYADWEIKNKLLSVPGVAQVLVYGGDVKQYQILINPEKLKKYNITFDQIIHSVEDANVILGGGYLVQGDREYLIRGLGKIQSKNDLFESVVCERNGIPIYLKDVADIQIGGAFKRSYGSVDGKEAVYVAVSKQPWANTVQLEEKIKIAIDDLQKTLPKDINITKTFSQADFVRVSIKNILISILEGSVLVIVILFIFLANLRSGFISLLAIPFSLITAILVLKLFGQTINAMTLGGLAVAVGEIVDDAIIDVENVYKRLKENKLSSAPKPVIDVIFNASYEVRHSVVYGTYIIVIVLVPILFLGGLAGQIFKPLAWAYIIAILSSLFVALTLTPALCLYLLSKGEEISHDEPRIVSKLKEKYSKALNKVILNPKKIFLTVGVLSFIALASFFFTGRSFLPELGEENLVIMAFTPPGSSLPVTQRIALVMEKTLLKYKNIVRVGNRAGRSESDDEPISSNLSHFDVTLKEGITNSEKDDLIEKIESDFKAIPGVEVIIKSFIGEAVENVISGQRQPIVIKLYGNDLNILRRKSDEVSHLLSEINTLSDIQIEPMSEIPQVNIKIKKGVASRYGLKSGELLRVIQVAFNGLALSQKVLEGQKSFDLYLWLKKSYRNNLEVIKNILIDTPSGVKIPLGQVADVYESTGPNIINREKASRRIVVLADAKKSNLSKAVEQAQKLIDEKLLLPDGYRVEFEGEYKIQKETNQKLVFLSFLVLVGIYILLSIAFKSFNISGIIMMNLPFALIGGILAVVLTNGVISIATVVGFITLFGISTRNTILLVNRFIDIRNENPRMSIDEVVKKGSMDRFVPIMMTALCAAFAMLPLAIFPGAGREIEHPLAIVILGGMFSATVLTLFIIPVIYKKMEAEKNNY